MLRLKLFWHWSSALLMLLLFNSISTLVNAINVNDNNNQNNIINNYNQSCPPKCTCDHETVKCSSLQLSDLKSLPSYAVNLKIESSYLGALPNNAFSGLSNLRTLTINNGRINHFDPRPLNGLYNLHTLKLTENNIETLPALIFQNTPLRHVELRKNRIRQLESGLFDKAPLIEYINLADNSITHIPIGIFNNLNRLTDLSLTGNPIICDCGAQSLWRHWKKLPHKSQLSINLQCEDPPYLPFDRRKEEDFDCATTTRRYGTKNLEFTKTATNITINGYSYEETKIFLDCAASGNPKPKISWSHSNGYSKTNLNPEFIVHSNGTLEWTGQKYLLEGLYICYASNDVETIKQVIAVKFMELPIIQIPPRNQTVKSGQSFALECDADGDPIPKIYWQFNGKTLNLENNKGHYRFENENTELYVSEASTQDSGLYKCVAKNEHGEVYEVAYVQVEKRRSPPRLIDEPFDIEAISGTTIELPCKALDADGIKITWNHDGRTINPNLLTPAAADKYLLTETGNLYVRNVTLRDGGRYECSIVNEYGRTTASALVTIRNIEDLTPGDRYVRIAFKEAASEIDVAIKNTVDTLFRNRTNEKPNFSDLLRVFRFPKGEARQLARAAEIYERTLVNIRKHVLQGANLSVDSDKYEFRDLLSREHLHLVAELSGCMEPREMPNCTDMCYHSQYRSIDGTCNNLQNPQWGSSLTAFRRIEKPIYENGFNMPIGWTKNKLYAGHPKPSARLISTELITTEQITPDDTITHMVMQWGQFLDHDLDHAIPSVSSESWDGVDCKKTCEFAPPCFPVEVPPNDPRIKNRRCIDIVRSSSICGSGMTSVFFDAVQHREQINQLTSYIDASQVYGFSYEFAQELRNLTTDDGLLRVGVQFPDQKQMLPFAAPQDGMDCRRNLDENTMQCFVAGDIRVNEQVGLLAMHTIWMREHNRIAAQFRRINPHWNGDTIYQETRKIIGAQMQHITFKHWLPLILGESGMKMLGEYKGYNANLDPTISNEFATVALRFGHTIINPILERLNASYQEIPEGHLKLSKAFFAPWRLPYEGGVDPLMRGMFAVPAKLKTPHQNLNSELTETLFRTAHAVALDLAAMNVQRGRDHGIPSYNVYRRFCNLSESQTFDELAPQISNADVRQKLQKLYGHPDNIDVWVGAVLEDQLPGAKVGPLLQCLLVEQFRRLRDGDRFYYENPSVFLPEQLQQIKQASLARVLCDTGDHITEITQNVFILPELQAGYTSCDKIDGINLYFWQDCATCNRQLPALLKSYVPQTYPLANSRRKRHDENHLDDVSSVYDMNEERLVGLEESVGNFQKELHRMHKKLRRLTEDLTLRQFKPKRSHCVDDKGTIRINNEVWTPNACKSCQCRHGQVNCVETLCSVNVCDANEHEIKLPHECCAKCVAKKLNENNNKNNTHNDIAENKIAGMH